MKSLHPEQRAAISTLIQEKRAATPGLSQEGLAELAEAALRTAAEDPDENATPHERDLWAKVEITRHHVQRFENCPARPLADPERRARLLGVVLALRIDRRLVNRMVGGL